MKIQKKAYILCLLAVLMFFSSLYAGFHSYAAADKKPSLTKQKKQQVTYENVSLQYYKKAAKKLPYIHESRVNNTSKTIKSTERGMLAFDKNGKPLKIKWNGLDSEAKPTYYFLYDWDKTKILPGKKDDVNGGWSLNEDGTDKNAAKIAYVLYCDKKIRFSDGTSWNNPNYNAWLKKYKGQKISVKELKNYYPYVQTIEN